MRNVPTQPAPETANASSYTDHQIPIFVFQSTIKIEQRVEHSQCGVTLPK